MSLLAGLNKNRNRRVKRISGQNTIQGRYNPPPRDKCEQDQLRYLRPSYESDIKLIGIAWKQAGRLVDFVLSVKYLDRENNWQSYIEIDCKHGHAHVHNYVGGKRDGKEPESLLRLNEVSDVNSALELAIHRGYLAARDAADRLNRGEEL